jgi:putative oxidoreductase
MADQSINMPVSKPGVARNVAGWIVCVVLAIAFLVFGGAKLAGARPMVQEFDHVGLGQWFRYFTGILEVSGAIGVLIPKYSRWGALLLVVAMCGALVAHFTVLQSSPSAAATLLVIALAAAWLRR